VGGASAEANDAAVAALAGVAPADLLAAHWRNSPYRPCHYVAIDRAAGCVVVSVRGSLEVGDLLMDLSASPMEVRLLGVDGWVHEGIMAAATFCHCATAAALEEAACRCPGWPVLLCGHSLGGGVAAVLSLLLQQQPGGLPGLGPVRCITMGGAAVMSAPLAAACEATTVSVVVGADPVPHLSVASVERLLLEVSAASPVRRAAQGLAGRVRAALGATRAAPAAAWASLREVNERMGAGGAAQAGAGLAGALSAGGGGAAAAEQHAAMQGQVSGVVDLRRSEDAALAQVEELRRREDALSAAASPMQEDGGPAAAGAGASGPEGFLVERIPGQGGAHGDAAMLYASADVDAGLLGAALAQERAARPEAPPETQGEPGDPELLFPPGRLLWIFPADEEPPATAAAAEGADAAPRSADVEAAWDAAWGGAAPPTPAAVPGGGAVDVGRAAEEAGGGGGGGGGLPAAAVPIVVDAERATFERLLLSGDMLNDHLPDRYLEAVRQL
jgi:hypothetical protein